MINDRLSSGGEDRQHRVKTAKTGLIRTLRHAMPGCLKPDVRAVFRAESLRKASFAEPGPTMELYSFIAALVFLVMLGALGKIHQQVNELRNALHHMSNTMNVETLTLRKQLEKMQAELDLIFKETNVARPTPSSG